MVAEKLPCMIGKATLTANVSIPCIEPQGTIAIATQNRSRGGKWVGWSAVVLAIGSLTRPFSRTARQGGGYVTLIPAAKAEPLAGS